MHRAVMKETDPYTMVSLSSVHKLQQALQKFSDVLKINESVHCSNNIILFLLLSFKTSSLLVSS